MTTALFLNATDRWSTILDLRGVTKQSKQRIHDMLGWAYFELQAIEPSKLASFSVTWTNIHFTSCSYLLSHIWSSWRPPKLLSSPQSQLKGRKGSDGWLRSIALILAVHLGKCLIFIRDNGCSIQTIFENGKKALITTSWAHEKDGLKHWMQVSSSKWTNTAEPFPGRSLLAKREATTRTTAELLENGNTNSLS